jgi:microcystin-dependent protein
MNIKDIVLIILIIISIYLLYKTLLFENFDGSSDIINEIDNQYKKDMDVIRNLTDFSKYIIDNNNIFNIPGYTYTVANNITIKGKLKSNKNIKFLNRTTKIFDIFPKYMVIPWYNNNIPKGWALCDGNRYTIGNDGNALKTDNENNSILTPDLRSRFIVGASNNATSDITPIPFKSEPNGEEKHRLLVNEIPSHQHQYITSIGGGYNSEYTRNLVRRFMHGALYIPPDGLMTSSGIVYHSGFMTNNPYVDPPRKMPINVYLEYLVPGPDEQKTLQFSTGSVGENIPHENMPRYYALFYIIKL